MKNIIIEGIDCSGKTTLASNIKFKLKEHGGYDLKALDHFNVSSQFKRYLYEYNINERVIFDRAHFSEAVFCNILRNEESFDNEELSILNKIVKLNYVTILALPKFEDFSKRMMETKFKQVIEIKHYTNIVDKFKIVMQNVNPIIYTSSSNKELEEITNRVISLIW